MHVWKVLTCSRGAGLHLMKQRSRSLTLFLAAVSAGLKIQRGVWTTSIPPLYNHFLHDMHTTQVGFCDDIWCVSVLHGKKATSKKATWNPIRVIILTWIYFFPVHRRLIFDVLSDHSISQYFTSSSLSPLAWSNRSHEWMSVVMAPTHLMDKATWEVLINFPWHRLYRETLSQTNKLCNSESRPCVHVCEKHWVTMRCISGHDNGRFHLRTAITGNYPPDGPAQFNPGADFIGFVS